MAKSADDLIRISKEDEPGHVADSEEVMNRLLALFVALEYNNICPFSVMSGSSRYIKELELFRKEQPGMAALLKADKLIRHKVAEINQDQRDAFPSLTEALLEVLNNHRYLWNEARSFARARSLSPEKTSSPLKKPRTDEHPIVSSADRAARKVS